MRLLAKGPYIGWLLAAVGIDANDGIYPIAYAVVENSEQQNYVKHIYTNFKTNERNRGKALKDVLWKATRSTYVAQFTAAMNEMKAISKDAHDWFADKAPSMWSKLHFSTRIINYNNMNVVSFVDPCYKKDTQLSIYGHHISPIRGVNQWTNVEGMEPILPPVWRRPVERPSKKRRLERDEVLTTEKVSKKGSKMTCTKCDKTGHNITTCKGKIGGNKYLKKPGSSRQPLRQKLPIRSRQKSIHQQPPSQHSTGQSQPPLSQHSTGQSQPPSVMTVRWMMFTQESSVSNPPAQASNAHD
ncbi:hypothetical protein V6N13_018641 [Hibiscus sabdariffa]